MTEQTNTMTNCRQSGSSSSSSYSIGNLVLTPIHQQEYVNNVNGLFDDDRHHLTLFDLQPVPISNHNLSIFDELSHQCDAVLYSSKSPQSPQSTIGINNFHSSYLIPTTIITMNEYERRFQRSLQKLTIPSWYIDTTPSSNISSSSKQSITSTTPIPWKTHYRESERTPEITHIRRPHSYRSCRSSLATSPSPSVHSWHPNHIMDGVNFSLSIPSSSSFSRRHKKYQKGIERVSKSSRWYQPTQFAANNSTKDQTGILKTSTSIKTNHYDRPKIHNNENIILKFNSDAKKTVANTQNNNMNPIDKQQDNSIKSNESQIMPLANIKESFNQIELEEITDDEDDKQLLSIEQLNHNKLLEHAANDLVKSVLADVLLLKNLDDNDEDKNSGVRELSEDENGLRELDENDMSDTDEFIVFATNAKTSDDDQTTNIPRYNLNRLYTFSKTNDNGLDHFKHQVCLNKDFQSISFFPNPYSSNKDNDHMNSSKSILEKKVLATNSNIEHPFDKRFCTSPIYQSHFEKQHINLDKYIDSITCPLNDQLSEGVNEETARIGRLLLDCIPISLIENMGPISDRSELKNTRFIEDYNEELNDKVRRDSAYSSNQERINIQQSIYEPLSECYSGYSFIQSDFLTTNISSIQSTTDEAYESEPTTMCSSIATTTYVHPYLEHEFEYPSPPPPVPDRRLKPTYLKTSPPPTKPRLTKQDNIDSAGYSIIQKTKPLAISTIQQFLTSTSNDSSSLSTRTMSSRHYCGSIPISNEVTKTSVNSIPIKPIKPIEQSKDKTKEKRNSRTLNCLHPSTTDDNHKRNIITKSSSSLNKTKNKKQKLVTDIDEATNGLAIRLPAPISNGHNPNKFENKTSTPVSIKGANVMTKNRQITDNIKLNRTPFYETSV